MAVSGDDPDDLWFGLALFESRKAEVEAGLLPGSIPLLANLRLGITNFYASDQFSMGVGRGHSLAWSRDQGVWYGTDQGLFQCLNGELKHRNVADGIHTSDINCVFVDHQDQVWIGTGQGDTRRHSAPGMKPNRNHL